jgi:hypothetical protein
VNMDTCHNSLPLIPSQTVAQCFGVGKRTIIKVLKSGVELNKLGVIGGHRCHYQGSGSFHECPLRRQTLSDNKL